MRAATAMMLFGLAWAALAPLSLVLMVLLLQRGLRAASARYGRARWSRSRAGLLAAVLVGVPVAALWWADWREFRAVCDRSTAVRVLERGQAEGIYLNSTTSNSFGMRYLHDEGFAWVEARDIYRHDGFVRYEKGAGGQVTTTPIDAPTARFEVREPHSAPHAHTHLALTEVVDRSTGRVIATAGSASFDGGTVVWLLGAWGSRSCPSAMDEPSAFQAAYHLARDTLRGRP